MKRFYLKALGDYCYSSYGITYPEFRPVNVEAIARAILGNNKVAWQKQFGWENQPEVLVFSATIKKAELFDNVINAAAKPPGSNSLPILKVMERDWA